MKFRLSRWELYIWALIAMVLCHIQQILVISRNLPEWFGWSQELSFHFGIFWKISDVSHFRFSPILL